MKHVVNRRTNETLYSSENPVDCVNFINENIGQDHEDFKQIWIEGDNS